jgi:hypothetical protein
MRIDCRTELKVQDRTVVTTLESVEDMSIGDLLTFIRADNLHVTFTVNREKAEVDKTVEELLEEPVPAIAPPRPARKAGRKLNRELKLSTTKINILRSPRLTPKGLKQWAKTYHISYSAAKRLRHASALDIKWLR